MDGGTKHYAKYLETSFVECNVNNLTISYQYQNNISKLYFQTNFSRRAVRQLAL